MTLPPTERLRIFVSSTIEECAAERAVIQNAIESLNHEAVLFEKVGARPHPPREVYRPRLETAHIFVGIYRESYGWIADGMTVSGAEDEFLLAAGLGMPCLVYVLREAPARQQKLQGLIERAMSDRTVWFYDEPGNLRERVRDDITAVVSDRFVDQPLTNLNMVSATEFLESLFPGSSRPYKRSVVEQDLVAALALTERLCVMGPLGGGKSVLLAQLSARHGWLFVDARKLTGVDVIAKAANSLRNAQGRPPRRFPNESEAADALLAGWSMFGGRTLVVDGAESPQAVWDLLPTGAHLVVSSRQPIAVPGPQVFQVPPLQADEIESWVSDLRGSVPSSQELSQLADKSQGNPLYLRFYALGEPLQEALSLQKLVIETFEALSPTAREVVLYLSLADRPLDLATLTTLVATGDGPERLVGLVNEAAALVADLPGGLSLVHEYCRSTLFDHVRSSPTRYSFLATRLGGYYERSEEYVRAFAVYDDAGEHGRADAIVDRAAFQAGSRGRGARSVAVFNRQVEIAVTLDHGPKEVVARISAAQALRELGDLTGAREQIGLARSRGEEVDDGRIGLIVREAELTLRLVPMSVVDRVSALASLREAYSTAGYDFESARTATALAELYIKAEMLAESEGPSRDALAYFSSVGDRYGQRVARVNLAAALSGLEGREEEGASIAQELTEEIDPDRNPRERAIICNIMTRRFRHSGKPELAKRFAMEAIEIGKRLGNHHVVAINHINLGNIERDQEALESALQEYRSADKAALEAADPRDEAFANFHIASVLNEQHEHALAGFHAQHAAVKAREAGEALVQARAYRELAAARRASRDVPAAIDAYIDAFVASEHHPTSKTWKPDVVCAALALAAEANRADLTLRVLVELFGEEGHPETGDAGADTVRLLYARLREMVASVGSERILPMVALAMSGVLAGAPRPIERRIAIQAAESLLRESDCGESDLAVLGLVAIVLACDWDSFSMADIVDLAEGVVKVDGRVQFKPQSDGAAHWNVRIGPDPAILVTVTQLDDNSRSAVIALVIACLLTSVGDRLCEDIIGTVQRPRHEAAFLVTSRSEFEAQIDSTGVDLGNMERGFGIVRGIDAIQEQQFPSVIVYDDGFGTAWRPAREDVADFHRLFAEILYNLASRLLAKELEPEVINPKVDGLMRKLIWMNDL